MQRKLISLITGFSFVGLILSSIILYFMPEGRVTPIRRTGLSGG